MDKIAMKSIIGIILAIALAAAASGTHGRMQQSVLDPETSNEARLNGLPAKMFTT